MKGQKCWDASKTLKMVPRHTWQSGNLHYARESLDVEWNAKKSLSLSLGQWVSNASVHQNLLEVLLKHVLLGPIPRAFALVSLRWGLKFCISKKFPSDADTLGLGNIFGEPLLYFPFIKANSWVLVSHPISFCINPWKQSAGWPRKGPPKQSGAKKSEEGSQARGWPWEEH